MPNKTLHLMTQRDQPHGSQRRCCERCGLMMVGRPDAFWTEHAWTHVESEFHQQDHQGTQFTACDGTSKSADVIPFPTLRIAGSA